MAKDTTFKVSKTGVEPVKVTFAEPENLNDPRWTELGVDQAGINELAVQNLVIKIQGIARGKLGDGPSAVQAAVDGYKYGQRASGGGTKKVSLSTDQVKQAKFTPEQLATLRAAGVVLPGMEEEGAETPAAAGKQSK
jgi:hypothetical protein